ncbi:MAG: putative toxin-antitoxin system toxin component, PIN family [Treponema sp.]|nr:putative toxin-antitoxin system toxin component, PIN family [Treponema sp.]
MRLVLDTNVVISAFINPKGKPSQIVKLILERKAEICYNSVILSEYEGVMLRPKFSEKININDIRQFISLIGRIGLSYNPPTSRIRLPDESDHIFYDTARGSGSLLISGNIKHYPKVPFILLPDEFLKQINS